MIRTRWGAAGEAGLGKLRLWRHLTRRSKKGNPGLPEKEERAPHDGGRHEVCKTNQDHAHGGLARVR